MLSSSEVLNSSSVILYDINLPSLNVGTFLNSPNHLFVSSAALSFVNSIESSYTFSVSIVPIKLILIFAFLTPSWLLASSQILVTGIFLFNSLIVLIAVNKLSE